MIEAKLFASLLVLFAGIGGGLFATQLAKVKGSEAITSLGNVFAGGVFLGAAFLHMLPDAIDNFNASWPGENFPMFALTAAVGFLVVMLLDKVLAPVFNQNRGGADQDKGVIYPYVLMLTLSVHSVITGMALGLETHLVSAGAILFAVLGHKSTAAMALAISFDKGGAPKPRARNLKAIFYATTPIGILLGTWVGTYLQGPNEVHFEAIFDALAAGTFFYIAVMDILSEEFEAKSGLMQKFLFAALGFTIMAVVAIWT